MADDELNPIQDPEIPEEEAEVSPPPRILRENPVGGKPPVLPIRPRSADPGDPEAAGKDVGSEDETMPPTALDELAPPPVAEMPEPAELSMMDLLNEISVTSETPIQTPDLDFHETSDPSLDNAPVEESAPVEEAAPAAAEIEEPDEETLIMDEQAPEAEPELPKPDWLNMLPEPTELAEPEEETLVVEQKSIRVPDLDEQIAALAAAPAPPVMEKPEPEEDILIGAPAETEEPRPSPFVDMSWLNVENEKVADVAQPQIEPPPVVQPPAGSPSRVTVSEQPITQPVTPPPAVPPAERVTKPDEWEEDISPELASVLFGGKERPAEPRSTLARPVGAAPGAAPAPIPAPGPQVIIAPTEPIHLTERDHAQSKLIMAKDLFSPSPDAVLTGKVRKVRIEEPLPNDQGEHMQEAFEYLRPDFPGLDGRLVQRVKVEEMSYADGSWHWRFERVYTDGGYDRREVRANRDTTYITRHDEISKRDIATQKKVKQKEAEAMIYAPPAPEKKRGLFGKKPEEPTGPKSWRPATDAEIKASRKTGGTAFSK